MSQTLARGPPTLRIQDSGGLIHRPGPQSRSVAAILDVDAKTLGKSFDKTKTKKG